MMKSFFSLYFFKHQVWELFEKIGLTRSKASEADAKRRSFGACFRSGSAFGAPRKVDEWGLGFSASRRGFLHSGRYRDLAIPTETSIPCEWVFAMRDTDPTNIEQLCILGNTQVGHELFADRGFGHCIAKHSCGNPESLSECFDLTRGLASKLKNEPLC